MTKLQIKEGNKLIAGFMMKKGRLHTPGIIYSCDTKNPTVDDICEVEDFFSMHYHTSWDWLMPVVEKIESLGMSTEIHYYGATSKNLFFINNSVTFLGYELEYDRTSQFDKKIDAVYDCVIKFIKWYNKNNKHA